MAWIAGIGLILSAASAEEANGMAGKAGKRQEALNDRELRIAESQEGRSAQMYREYQTFYQPRERELVDAAFSEESSPEAAAARATANVREASATGGEIQLRNARRLGINPSSGTYAALDNQKQIGEIGLEAAARDTARRTTKDINFGRQMSVLSLGRNLPNQSASAAGQAAAIYGGLGDQAGRMADRYNTVAGQAGSSAGYYAGQLGSELGDWYRRRNQPTSTAPMSSGTHGPV